MAQCSEAQVEYKYSRTLKTPINKKNTPISPIACTYLQVCIGDLKIKHTSAVVTLNKKTLN